MNVKECFDKKLLKKINPDKEKSEGSLKIAENKLGKAGDLLKGEFDDESLLSSYTSMFHAARSLLYKEGVQEKSHYAVYVYINEKYANKIPRSLIESFKVYQLERHNVLYGFDKGVSKEEAESAIEDAEEFLNKIKDILNG